MYIEKIYSGNQYFTDRVPREGNGRRAEKERMGNKNKSKNIENKEHDNLPTSENLSFITVCSLPVVAFHFLSVGLASPEIET